VEAESTKRIEALFTEYGEATAGGAVAVVRGREPVFTGAYGMADLERDVPNTTRTRFNLGSMSKQFTAFAVLLLETDGALGLDDEARAHLPRLHDFGVPITLRHLMHHTSGLRGTYPELLVLGGWRFTDHITHEDCLRLLYDQRELSFAPGSESLYVNSNYVLLAETVARVAGMPFAEFCRRRIFEPLGMEDTLVMDEASDLMPRRALGYYQDDDGWHNLPLTDSVVGPTNVYSTADDLTRWLVNLGTGEVGGREVMQKMVEPGCLADGTDIGYAGGLMVGPGAAHRGRPAVQHGGQHGGYTSAMYRFPEDDMAVVFLCNHFRWDSAAVVLAVADVILDDPGSETAASPVEEQRADAEPEDLAPLAGTYFDPSRRIVRAVGFEDGHLTYMDLPLVPIGDRLFTFAEEPGTTVRFGEAGLVLSTGTSDYTYERVDPVEPTPAELAACAGRFESSELHVCWEVEAEDGGLRIRRHKHVDTLARPMFAGVFSDDWEPILGYPGSFLIEFEEGEDGGVPRFRVSGDRVRGVRFERV
jgi:CubicO group peptidase (beta-lactamase class C family)